MKKFPNLCPRILSVLFTFWWVMDSFSKYVSKGFIHVFREGWVTVDRLQEFIYSQFIFHNC